MIKVWVCVYCKCLYNVCIVNVVFVNDLEEAPPDDQGYPYYLDRSDICLTTLYQSIHDQGYPYYLDKVIKAIHTTCTEAPPDDQGMGMFVL